MDDYYGLLEAQLRALTERGAHRRRLGGRMSRPRISGAMVALAGSAAVVLTITGIFITAGGGLHAIGPAAHGGSNGIDPTLIRNFKILRRPLQSSDRLPPALPTAAVKQGDMFRLATPPGQPTPASLGLLPALARRVVIPGTQFSAWLIPGRRGFCWDARHGTSQLLAAVCGPLQDPNTALLDRNGTAIYRAASGGLITVGLVTDRVLSVEQVTRDGKRHQLPLSQGFFVASYTARVIAITANGPRTLLPVQALPGGG
jgi:hypothetical protein